MARGPRSGGGPSLSGGGVAAGGEASSLALGWGRPGHLTIHVTAGLRVDGSPAGAGYLNCAELSVLQDSVLWSPATCRVALRSGAFRRRLQGPRGALGKQACHAGSHPRCPHCRGASGGFSPPPRAPSQGNPRRGHLLLPAVSELCPSRLSVSFRPGEHGSALKTPPAPGSASGFPKVHLQ